MNMMVLNPSTKYIGFGIKSKVLKGDYMKELYLVSVWRSRLIDFEEYYDEKEIEVIQKFLNDLYKHDVINSVPYIEFEKKT